MILFWKLSILSALETYFNDFTKVTSVAALMRRTSGLLNVKTSPLGIALLIQRLVEKNLVGVAPGTAYLLFFIGWERHNMLNNYRCNDAQC